MNKLLKILVIAVGLSGSLSASEGSLIASIIQSQKVAQLAATLATLGIVAPLVLEMVIGDQDEELLENPIQEDVDLSPYGVPDYTVLLENISG